MTSQSWPPGGVPTVGDLGVSMIVGRLTGAKYYHIDSNNHIHTIAN